ncbi:hypothetical protein C3B59_06440 [Cryobacterium zongtaii]|uniref:Uncharacterized protein n=1 Tax=Cryobacterium zongtaii TaxID=1259217 RepID=A0A2S3ZK17_9MICO|nr:hypothetical protein [Cryobacterium zongtaii]POH68387.1 hypothetical protein C3B59_06440 [Cryobacterium zongtaii]
MGTTAHLISPLIAARFALTVMLAAVAVAATAVLMIALSRDAAMGEAWAAVAGAYPSQAAIAVLAGTVTLTLLLVFSPPTGHWGLGGRSVLAGYAGVASAALSLLLVAEWIPGEPGAAGGPAVLAAAILGFTLAGGPLWIGLIAVLLGRTALLPRGIGTQRLSASERSRFGAVLIAAGLCLAAIATSGAYLVAVHGGLDYACAVEGPFSPLAELSERAGVVTGSFSWWPLGRSCTWAAAGGGTVLATSGWSHTVLVLASLGLAAAGIALRTTRAGQTDAPAEPTSAELGT